MKTFSNLTIVVLLTSTQVGCSFMHSRKMNWAPSLFLLKRDSIRRLSNIYRSTVVSMDRKLSADDSCSEVNTEACEVPTEMKGPDLPPISSTSKRLFLVRHGEVINPGGNRPVFYGALDVPLSPLGELEAKAAAQYLSQFELQNVAASPLSRAIFGGNEIVSLQKSLTDLTILEGFKELDRGDWCGKTKDEIGPDLERFDACDETVTPEGGESYPILKQRVLSARDELLNLTDHGKASAVVSHLQVTRSMLSDALGIPIEEMVNLKVATASVTCIDFDSISGTETTTHFQSFKPEAGLQISKDGAN